MCMFIAPRLHIVYGTSMHSYATAIFKLLILTRIVYLCIVSFSILVSQIPPELVKMAEDFKAKVEKGEARYASSGFSGKGFTFDDSEQSESQQVRFDAESKRRAT